MSKSRKYFIRLIILWMMVALNSCFEKDIAVTPHLWNGESYVIPASIYSWQQYYSFEKNTILASHQTNAWDIAFDSRSKGWMVRLNSGNGIAAYHTNIQDFTTMAFNTTTKNWLFDKSDGDSTSTAIGNWVNTNANPYDYSGEVYLIGQYNGSTYQPYKKVIFTWVNDTMVHFRCADLNNSNFQEVTIRKDTSTSYSFYNLTEMQPVHITPAKDTWDLLFTPYLTTLYATDGQPLPYLVRGVLLNPNFVKVAIDSTKSFEIISAEDISSQIFSNTTDKIGYSWKKVDINFQSNTGVYSIRKNYTYLIQSVNGSIYKLRFTSFYNALGVEGFPAFEFLKIR